VLRRDFPAIRRQMGQSRTIGAVKSFFSKNRRRLDLDRLADEAAAKLDAAEMANANLQVTLCQFSCPPLDLHLWNLIGRQHIFSQAVGFFSWSYLLRWLPFKVR
jgi:hypothetical protein